MGNSCKTLFQTDPDGEVTWFRAGSAQSNNWQNMEEGFGYRGKISYHKAAIDHPGYNRFGNTNGELSGRIVFFKQAESSWDYSTFDEVPTINLQYGEKLFAKAFFNVPLGRIPIGTNNISSEEPHGEGACLLALRPRKIALFIEVNGEPQPAEHYCLDSKTQFMADMGSLNLTSTTYDVIHGSFFTFMCMKEQHPYCFIHLPLVGTLSDTSLGTGPYGEALIRAFTVLLRTLGQGQHYITISIKYYYDHCDYNCLVFGPGTNALGRWYKGISNHHFKSPHEAPDLLDSPDEPIAVGHLLLEITESFNPKIMVQSLDRQPPPEKYTGKDANILKRCAKIVASGKLCHAYNLTGLPDWVVLTSEIQIKQCNTKLILFNRGQYEMIEFTALWYNEINERRPDLPGRMVDCSMVRGETKPGVIYNDWVWAPCIRNNVVVTKPRIRTVKNKAITLAAKGRRVSVLTPGGKTIWAAKKRQSILKR